MAASRAGSAAGVDDMDMEVAAAAPSNVRRIDAEEQRWLDLEDFVAKLDRHLVVERKGRQVRCPSCLRDKAAGFDGFCLDSPACMDECLDTKQRCTEHVQSERHKRHLARGLRQALLPFRSSSS